MLPGIPTYQLQKKYFLYLLLKFTFFDCVAFLQQYLTMAIVVLHPSFAESIVVSTSLK